MNYIKKSDFSTEPFCGLVHMPDPPKGLYIKGDESSFKDLHYITVVGSRNCSIYAKEVLEDLIQELQGYPIAIISGLALGIDSHAHRQAIRFGLPTIAVPGSGLDSSVIYPASNLSLARDILSSGGLLLSEYTPDTKAARWTFPQRNRIMAALADLVIIVEASEKSGTLITARLALDYNKTIGVIPADIIRTSSIGSNKLMQDGAHPILSFRDILSLLGIPEQEKEIIPAYLTDKQRCLIEIIQEPQTLDDIQKTLQVSYDECIELVSTLEIQGIITQEYGRIKRAYSK